MAFPLTNLVTAAGLWGPSPFFLVDVGASGGIAGVWSALGERFRAIGFDPLIAEVARLNSAEKRPDVSYEAAFVGYPRFDEVFPPSLRHDPLASRLNQPFHRSSAVRAQALKRSDYVREEFNQGEEVRYTDRHISLDERFGNEAQAPDFIKIDTDGGDYQVLLGAENVLARGVLGIHVESQFHGVVHDYGNLFSNIDRFLRARGFSLFDLSTWRYSRADLPAPFVYEIAAQTRTGQVSWGDALYLRDLALPGYDGMFQFSTTLERVLKLACLHELFGLPDCAAELVVHARQLGLLNEVTPMLDALTPTTHGRLTYREYIDRFTADPDAWLPSRIGAKAAASAPAPDVSPEMTMSVQAPPVAGSEATATDPAVAVLRQELDETRAKVRLLRHRTAKLQQEREAMRAELRTLRARAKDERAAPPQ